MLLAPASLGIMLGKSYLPLGFGQWVKGLRRKVDKPIPTTLESVSYTHLDVYKRQHLASLPDEPAAVIVAELQRLGIPEAHWDGYLECLALETVSYTHLDVYKRQVEACYSTAKGVIITGLSTFPTTKLWTVWIL